MLRRNMYVPEDSLERRSAVDRSPRRTCSSDRRAERLSAAAFAASRSATLRSSVTRPLATTSSQERPTSSATWHGRRAPLRPTGRGRPAPARDEQGLCLIPAGSSQRAASVPRSLARRDRPWSWQRRGQARRTSKIDTAARRRRVTVDPSRRSDRAAPAHCRLGNPSNACPEGH